MELNATELLSEQAVIGCIMCEPGKVVPEAAAKLISEDFETPEFRRVFDVCMDLYRRNEAIDPVTVVSHMGDAEKEYKRITLEAAQATPSTANYKAYIQHVADLGKRRRAYLKARDLELALEERREIPECQKIAGEVLKAFDGADQGAEANALECISGFFATRDKPVEYIRTGLSVIDNGVFISPGDYVVVGGRPSTGKTALTLQIMLEMAKKRRVVYFSLETGKEEITDRMISNYTGTSSYAIKQHNLTAKDWERISGFTQQFAGLDFYVVEAAGWTVDQIRAKAMQLKADVIFIDYLGLISYPSASSLYEKATQISIALHTMAQGLKMTIVALVQLNRSGKETPDMSSIRDSGQIEQDADLILFLRNLDEEKDMRELIVQKNKKGKTGKFPLAFDGDIQRFSVIDTRFGGMS